MTQKTNFDLMRPFNQKAAEAGALLCTKDLPRLTYVAGPDGKGVIAVSKVEGDSSLLLIYTPTARMVPLAWVKGKPVYDGDTLYIFGSGDPFVCNGVTKDGLLFQDLGNGNKWIPLNSLVWEKPKKEEREEEKHFSLLQRITIDEIRNGEKVCWHEDGEEAREVLFTSTNLVIPVYPSQDTVGIFTPEEAVETLRRAPLAWVEKRPVYVGSRLWSKIVPRLRYDVSGISSTGNIMTFPNDTGSSLENPSNLTWTITR